MPFIFKPATEGKMKEKQLMINQIKTLITEKEAITNTVITELINVITSKNFRQKCKKV